MRIAHIEAGRHLYGGAAQVRYLIEGLASHGVENMLFCPAGSELGAAAPAAQVVELPMHGELGVALLPRLARAFKRWQPDLVHVHSRRGADLYGGWAAALAGIPAVVTRRVDAVEPAALARLKYRPYRAVIALSRAIERQLRDAGIPPQRSLLIPSGVDTQRYRPDAGARERLAATFGFHSDVLAVGVVAQLIERKRHTWLFALLPELSREFPQLRVICFGRGPLGERLRTELKRLGLTERVTLAGFRGDLPELVPGLDVLVHPAAREGLGVALLEAGSAGVPVVACDVGGVPDVVVDGETGRLVPAADAAALRRALAGLLSSATDRRRLGAAARRRIERHFGLGKLVAEHFALYTRVLGERAGAPVLP
jgi:glycosyltransferase involved in cell wall biosynthesis